MCDRDQPRYLVINQVGDETPIDLWMNENLPEDYRLVSVTRDKIVTEEVTIVYQFFLEIIDG
jgi:hypothetical protein